MGCSLRLIWVNWEQKKQSRFRNQFSTAMEILGQHASDMYIHSFLKRCRISISFSCRSQNTRMDLDPSLSCFSGLTGALSCRNCRICLILARSPECRAYWMSLLFRLLWGRSSCFNSSLMMGGSSTIPSRCLWRGLLRHGVILCVSLWRCMECKLKASRVGSGTNGSLERELYGAFYTLSKGSGGLLRREYSRERSKGGGGLWICLISFILAFFVRSITLSMRRCLGDSILDLDACYLLAKCLSACCWSDRFGFFLLIGKVSQRGGKGLSIAFLCFLGE